MHTPRIVQPQPSQLHPNRLHEPQEIQVSSLFSNALISNPVQRHEALQAGLNLIDQGFTLIDENLRMVAWNTTFLRLLDFPESMISVGTPFEDFMRFNAARGEYGAGDTDQQIRERMEAAKAFQPHDIERVRPNGTVLRVHGVPVPGHGFVTLYSDVTEQRRAEKLIRDQNALLESRVAERTAELRRSEAQMRLVTDSIPALVAYFDQHRSYRYINRGYQDWFGLDPSHPEAVSAREYLGADTYTRIKPHVSQALRGEAVTFEYDVRTVDGRALVARTSLIPELATSDTGHATVIGCFELTFDITEERRSHELLVQAQKMEALGQLTGGLAHDFNNILTVVLGNLIALAEQPSAKPHVTEFINPAIDAARRGSKLIQGLLSFSRKQPLEAKVVDVNPLVMSVDELVGHTLPDSLTLTTEVALEPLIALLDPHQLQNALLNLVLNARDATDGRGTIRLRCADESLDVIRAAQLGLPPGPYACVQVQDNGCGMDTATKARVFEPFFTTKVPGRGTGLGMAMVYGFARQSGGRVDIQSEPGTGTQVSLWLPAAPKVPASTTGFAQIDTVAGEAGHAEQGLALLVEDDASVRQTVRRLLLDLGYSVLEAETGTEAVTILDQTPGIRLVLSDIVMPGGVDGRQVARHALGRSRVHKVILMSGYAPDSEDTPDVPLLGKPFTKAELAAALLGIPP